MIYYSLHKLGGHLVDLLFWISTFLFVSQTLYIVFKKKDYFNLSVYLMFGIHLPFVLYLFNWSTQIEPNISPIIYMMLSLLNMFVFLVNSTFSHSINDREFNFTTLRSNRSVYVLNCIYLSIVLLENYMGSGYFLPALKGIDIHTYSAPILSYLTQSLFTVLLLNFMYWYKSRKKNFVFWIVIFIALPLVGKSSRMTVVVSLIQLISFVLFMYLNDRKYKKRKVVIFNKVRHKIVLAVILVALMSFMIFITEYRWGGYGKIQVSYADSIGFTGPEAFQNTTSIYYGYFALSYNNLNMNIQHRDINHNYVGFYSFKSIYFGLFRLHNIFDLNPYEPEVEGLSKSGSATVPTGFFDFYYDYGIFCFIPILVGAIIYYFLKKRVHARNSTVFNYAVYFLWIPVWFFMSFQNVIYESTLIVRVIVLYLVVNHYLYKKNNKLEGSN